MKERELEKIEAWFREFSGGYCYEDPVDQGNVLLKVEHTWRVAANITEISAGIAGADRLLARAIGVLHDTGRFPQYHTYRTFRDSASVNHGALGARVIEEAGALSGLSSRRDREAILNAIRYHNAFGLPVLEDDGSMLYVKLIRDADKLDVWRVLADFYEAPEDERSMTVGQDMAESPGCSPEALERLASGLTVPISLARNFNDMRLLYISWVYDLNFPETSLLALGRGDLMRIASGLPDSPDVSVAVGRALERLRDTAMRAHGPETEAME